MPHWQLLLFHHQLLLAPMVCRESFLQSRAVAEVATTSNWCFSCKYTKNDLSNACDHNRCIATSIHAHDWNPHHVDDRHGSTCAHDADLATNLHDAMMYERAFVF